MQTPTNETSYVIPVMTPQASVPVASSAADSKERKMRDQDKPTGATHVADIDSGKDWDVPFFGCFANILPNCCMATLCPCVSIAQIQARLGNSYHNALYSFGVAIFGLAACIVLFISHSVTKGEVKTRRGQNPGMERSTTGQQIIFACGAMFFVLFYAFSLCLVRMRVRKQYEIKGSCAEDCFVSTCCAPCTVAQMASATQSYTPGVCSFQQPRIDTLPGYPGYPIPVAPVTMFI